MKSLYRRGKVNADTFSDFEMVSVCICSRFVDLKYGFSSHIYAGIVVVLNPSKDLRLCTWVNWKTSEAISYLNFTVFYFLAPPTFRSVEA